MKKTGLNMNIGDNMENKLVKGKEVVLLIADKRSPEKLKNKYGVIYKKISTDKFDNMYIQENTKCNFLNLMNCLNDEFEIIEEPKVWKPKEDEEYYYIQNAEEVESEYYTSEYDKLMYGIGNCFRTKEEAKKALEKIKIYVRLKRYAEEHNTEKIDWGNEEQSKWNIILYTRDDTVETANTYVHRDLGQIYFTSEELCKQAIQEIGKENIKKLFED